MGPQFWELPIYPFQGCTSITGFGIIRREEKGPSKHGAPIEGTMESASRPQFMV